MNSIVKAMVIVSIVSILGCVVISDDANAAPRDATFSVNGNTGTWDEISGSVSDGATVQVVSSGTVPSTITIDKDVTLDLNGQQIRFTVSGDEAKGIHVNDGASLNIVDGVGEGSIVSGLPMSVISNYGSVNIHSVSLLLDGTGTVMLSNRGVMEIHDTMMVSTSTSDSNFISNRNNLYISDSSLETQGSAIQNANNPKTVDSVVCVFDNVDIKSGVGVTCFGAGNSPYVEDSVVFTMNGGSIESDLYAASTNATNGTYAGVVLNFNNVEISTSSVTFYFPAMGVYNINGGSVSGGQTIKISAGTLNVTGGAVIESDGAFSEEDLVLSTTGAGGAEAAIVVAKGPSGYYGKITVNIDDATIRNTAGGDAILISDACMGNGNYSEYGMEFNLIGGKVEGTFRNATVPVVNPSTGESVTTGTTSSKDSDNVSVNLNGGSITGNVVQDSGAPVKLNGSTVDGDIVQSSDTEEPVIITGGTITGKIPEGVPTPEEHTLNYDSIAGSVRFFGSSVTLSSEVPVREGYTFLGWSMQPSSSEADYKPGQTITDAAGNVTLYAVWQSDSPEPTPTPGYDDDEDLPPFIPTQPAGDDDTVTIVACAAAAAVAAILAVFLVIDRKG